MSFLFQFVLKPCYMLIDFIRRLLAGIAIFFLEDACKHFEFTGIPVQIVVGEFAPPRFGFASDLFPPALEYIFVDRSSFGSWIEISTV